MQIYDPDNLPPIINGAAVVNGVTLSRIVLDQLREAGINADWCTPHQLAAVDRGAAVDCKVFDEPDGDNFDDMLTLDSDEIAENDQKTSFFKHACDDIAANVMSFCERLQQERQSKSSPLAAKTEASYRFSA
jgi:hypothetical protein